MKKLVLTLIAVAAFSASVVAQGTIAADNLNGLPGSQRSSLGLFYLNTTTLFTGPSVNITILGGPDAGSLTPVVTLVGPTAMVSGGNGVYLDGTGSPYPVAGVGSQANATLQVQAWRGSALTYGAAALTDQFYAWNGSTYVPGNTFTFVNGTGGPTPAPPKLPQSLDGMPAMVLAIPEPSTIALAGLGAAALLIFRRRKQ